MALRAYLERHGDRILAATLILVTVAEIWLRLGAPGDEVPLPIDGRFVATHLGAVVLAAALAWRRSMPLVVILIGLVAVAIAPLPPVDAPIGEVLALVVATYSVGAHTTARRAAVGAIGVAALVGIAIAKELGPDQEINDVAVPILILAGPWLAGLSIRSRHEREIALDAIRAEQSKAAVVDERTRIARDLHDAVAHSIGVILLQARGARRRLDADPPSARDALDVIESTASEALVEMRGLVGVLRDHDARLALAPPPSLRHIDALVERVREAGLPVDVTIEGVPVGLPAGIDASAYRIVQEALTNSLAHAGGATASVVIRYGVDHLGLEIVDTGVGVRGASREGHGLVGMRERVQLHSGRIETGPKPGGGFRVWADLPLRPSGA